MALSKTTHDHDTIRKWAEARGAMPAEVKATHRDNEPGILRFCFPKARNHNDANLHEISWDEFFEKFDENGLELIYQEKTADGQVSNFNKLIYPEDEHGRGKGHSSSTTSARASHSASGSSAGKSSRSSGSSSGKSSHTASTKSHAGSSKSSHTSTRSGSSKSAEGSSRSSGSRTATGKSSSTGRSSHSTSSRKKAA